MVRDRAFPGQRDSGNEARCVFVTEMARQRKYGFSIDAVAVGGVRSYAGPVPRLFLAIALVLAVALTASAGAATTVRAPKSGSEYRSGSPSDVVMRIAGRSVEIVAISFPCGDVTGRTSLNDFRLKRTTKGYRFNADAHGLVGYSDEASDQNADVHISGRFALDAKTVRGHIRVRSKRCGDTGDLKWRAARAKGSA